MKYTVHVTEEVRHTFQIRVRKGQFVNDGKLEKYAREKFLNARGRKLNTAVVDRQFTLIREVK